MDDAARLEIATQAARDGGRVAREHLGDPLYFKLRGRRDFELGSALLVQEAVLRSLRAACPDEPVLAKEGPADEVLPLDAERLWIVSPIDGPVNYFQGVPLFAVSIAYREAGSVRLGVVFDPSRDELFAAALGRGASLNGEPIAVSRPGEGEEVYEQTVVGTDWSGEAEPRARALRAAARVASHMLTLSVLGSPALGLCYVASGRFHAYFHFDLRLWDLAAAAVILQESGGILTNDTGGSWLHSEGGYLATNGAVHGILLRLFRDARQDVPPGALVGPPSPGPDLEGGSQDDR